MEMPCGNLKRLINYPSIALTPGYQRLKSKSYPYSEHLEPSTVYLWLGLNFDLSFFLWRRIFSFLYTYLFIIRDTLFLAWNPQKAEPEPRVHVLLFC